MAKPILKKWEALIAKIKHGILSSHYFITAVYPLIWTNGFRKHDYAAEYMTADR